MQKDDRDIWLHVILSVACGYKENVSTADGTVNPKKNNPPLRSHIHRESTDTYIGFQQVVHAGLGHLLGLVELLQSLLHLLVRDLPLPLLLVVVVQTTTLQLF